MQREPVSARRGVLPGTPQWRQDTKRILQAACDGWVKGGLGPHARTMLERLLETKEFWMLLDFLSSRKHPSPVLEGLESNWTRSPVEVFVFEALFLGCVCATGEPMSEAKKVLRNRRQPYDRAINQLEKIVGRFPSPYLRLAIQDLARHRDVLVDPESIAPRGGSATPTSVAFRSIAKLIPKAYAEKCTEKHRRAVEAISSAIGVHFTRYSYRDIFDPH
jgi:hypothetical protein